MNSIINFDNSRIIRNCSNLCYTNCAIHLLYSIVEFREKIYNTNVINPTDSNHKVNNILYYLKYIFLLMNKELTPIHSRYEVNDTHIECRRNSDSTGNLFYKEIYEPLLILIINDDRNELNLLKTCSFNNNLFEKYIRGLIVSYKYPTYDPICGRCGNKNKDPIRGICRNCNSKLNMISDISNNNNIDIFKDLFTNLRTLFYCINNLDELNYTQPNEFLKKYVIFVSDGKPVNPEINIRTTTGNSITYELIGSIYSYGGGGHFWAYIYNKNTGQSLRIDDLTELRNEVAGPNPNFLLYIQKGQSYVDNYPITQQISNIASISHEINSGRKNRLNELNHKVILELIKNKLKQKVCRVCTLINKSNATKCTACGTNL